MASATETSTRTFCVENTDPAAPSRERFFKSERFADFHFWLEKNGVFECIPAHRNFLVASSDVFDVMLNGDWKEEKEVRIVDATYDGFLEFLQFVYKQNVNISMENVCEVVYLADKYNVGRFMDLCEPHIIRLARLDEIYTCLDLALQFDLEKLEQHCLKIIRNDTRAMLTTEEFLHCSKGSLTSILNLDQVDCDEIEMFNASLNWAKTACEYKKKDPLIVANIVEELGGMIHTIRFVTMEPDEVINCIAANDGLFDADEKEDLRLAIGSDKTRARLFKCIVPRARVWKDVSFIRCDFPKKTVIGQGGFHTIKFQISQPLLFAGVAISPLIISKGVSHKGNLCVFEKELNSQKIVLEQSIELYMYKENIDAYNNRINYSWIRQDVKFKKAIQIRANVEYEVRVEIALNTAYYNYYVFNFPELRTFDKTDETEQREFGEGIVRIVDNNENVVHSCYFKELSN